jgi:uncharacterized surface protein with fasciclin (FAS1) repeats
MKIVSVLLSVGLLNAAPLPQAVPSAQNNTQQLLDAITAQERSLRISFRFLKTLARTYTDEIEKYSLPNSNVTVFLPSDNAFLDVPVDDLFNATKVAQFVQYHGTPSLINSSAIVPGGWHIARTYLGEDVRTFKHANGTLDILSTASTRSRVIAETRFGSVTAFFVQQILNPPASVLDTVFQYNQLSFTTLLRSYLNANTTRVLRNVTVFVPSEEAISDFVKVCNGSRLSDASIQSVLEYHITSGRTYHSSFAGLHNQTVLMSNGLNVTALYNGTLVPDTAPITLPPSNSTANSTTTTNSTVPSTTPMKFMEQQFNATLTLITPTGNATVITKDILAANAVVHIIDRVLLPPGINVTCTA